MDAEWADHNNRQQLQDDLMSASKFCSEHVLADLGDDRTFNQPCMAGMMYPLLLLLYGGSDSDNHHQTSD